MHSDCVQEGGELRGWSEHMLKRHENSTRFCSYDAAFRLANSYIHGFRRLYDGVWIYLSFFLLKVCKFKVINDSTKVLIMMNVCHFNVQ